MGALSPYLIERYDRPGPRYTSYPTAAVFHDDVGPENLAARLAAARTRPERPLALYLHLPFCEERCHYCGCHALITKKRAVARRYLELLAEEIRAVAARLGGRRRVRQLHWGGGTPTYLSSWEMRFLGAVLSQSFELEKDAEVAVEADPRVTSPKHLATLRDLGFNRLSLGVQDFTPEVQRAINRVQRFCTTEELVDEARALGFSSINLDLIYGLPKQRAETFGRAVRQALLLRPDRFAVYGYAHMPWIKPHQRRIDMSDLPGPEARRVLFDTAAATLEAAGYVRVGMDHFALPQDELARALSAGTLSRNFMGYTVRHAPDTIGLGLSAISDVDGLYVQNERKLSRYESSVESGRLPVERGYELSEDDRIRRHVIRSLMCALRLDLDEVESRFALRFRDYFRNEWDALAELEMDGLVRRSARALEVTEAGRHLLRNVCMVFDAHLVESQGAARPQHSRTLA